MRDAVNEVSDRTVGYATMNREPNLAGPAGRIAGGAILDGWRERTQGVSIHLRTHKALVSGECATADIGGNYHVFGTRLRDSCQLCVEAHSSRRTSQGQRDRGRDPGRYIDVRQDVVMQKLGDVEQRQASLRH